MARPTVSGLKANQEFAPGPQRFTSLEVTAPLDVTVERVGAANLADALGVGTKLAAQLVERNEKETAAAGKADAALQQVDPKKYQENVTYARAAYAVEVERQAQDFLQKWEARYTNDLDKTSTPDVIAQDFDQQAKAALGHFLEDDDAKIILAKPLSEYINKRVGAHITEQSKQRNERALEVIGGSIARDIEDIGFTDFNAQFQKLAPLVGNTAAKHFITQQVVRRASELGAPEAIARSLPNEFTLPDGTTIPGPARDPSLADMVTKGTETATAAKTKRDSVVREQTRFTLESGYVDRINSGAWLTKEEVFRKQTEGLISESEAVSWYSRSESARIAFLKSAETTKAMDSGLPLWALDLTDKERGETIRSRVDQLANRNGGDLVAAAVEVARRDGFADPRVVNVLSNAPPTMPKAFDEAATRYLSIPPSLREKFVPNEDRRAAFTRYLQLRESGAEPEAAAKELVEFSSDVAKNNRERYRTDTGRAVQTIPSLEIDDGGFFGRATLVSELANGSAVASRIESKMQMYVERGVAPTEALEQAKQEVLNQGTFVKMPDGRSLLMPIPRGAPPRFDEALKDTYTRMPEFLKENNVTLPAGFDPKNVRLSYSPTGDSTRLILVNQNGIPVSSKTFSPTDLTNSYVRRVDPKMHAEREAHRKRRAQIKQTEDELRASGLMLDVPFP